MDDQSQNLNTSQVGDKVRLRFGSHAGEKGIVRAITRKRLQIDLMSGKTTSVTPEEVTNFSLAARRAWQAMPKRSGRPRLKTPRKKMVSMRLDIDLWEQLGQATELGLITNRQDAINSWVREQLNRILGK